MANQYLGLSLFIMLLSFFIVLNSMSTFDIQKSAPILNSLALSFSKEKIDPLLQPGLEASLDDSFMEGNSLEKISGLFEAQIKGVDVSKSSNGSIMRLRMDVEELEAQLADMQNGEQRRGLAPTLVSLMDSQDAAPFRMDMVLNIKDNPANIQNEKPATLATEMKTVSRFADVMEGAGLPKKMMTAGIGTGPKNTIDLYFMRHTPFDYTGR